MADISVLTRLDEAYTVMHVSDFAANAAAGWEFLGGATAGTTTCGDFKLLGGYDVLAKGGSVVKTVTSMEEHTLLTISFEFVKLDTWDGEAAKLFVDDALVWTQAIGSSSGAALYGSATICGLTTADAVIPVTITVPHDEAMAKIRFTTTLDSGATDEACTSACVVSVVNAQGHGRSHACACMATSVRVARAALMCDGAHDDHSSGYAGVPAVCGVMARVVACVGAFVTPGGIKSLAVYGSSPNEHVAYASNFADAGTWVFTGATAGVTKCGTYNVLGGYGVLDKKDTVALTLTDMIPHSTMTVSFDFIKVGVVGVKWLHRAARVHECMRSDKGDTVCAVRGG